MNLLIINVNEGLSFIIFLQNTDDIKKNVKKRETPIIQG